MRCIAARIGWRTSASGGGFLLTLRRDYVMMSVKIYGAEDARMAAEIIAVAREACPGARLIGRRYEGAAN